MSEVLTNFGYALIDDAWDHFGRRTYLNDQSETRPFLHRLLAALRPLGWDLDQTRLRAFRNREGDIIEIEPGGADTSGHYLHHIKAEAAA